MYYRLKTDNSLDKTVITSLIVILPPAYVACRQDNCPWLLPMNLLGLNFWDNFFVVPLALFLRYHLHYEIYYVCAKHMQRKKTTCSIYTALQVTGNFQHPGHCTRC